MTLCSRARRTFWVLFRFGGRAQLLPVTIGAFVVAVLWAVFLLALAGSRTKHPAGDPAMMAMLVATDQIAARWRCEADQLEVYRRAQRKAVDSESETRRSLITALQTVAELIRCPRDWPRASPPDGEVLTSSGLHSRPGPPGGTTSTTSSSTSRRSSPAGRRGGTRRAGDPRNRPGHLGRPAVGTTGPSRGVRVPPGPTTHRVRSYCTRSAGSAHSASCRRRTRSWRK